MRKMLINMVAFGIVGGLCGWNVTEWRFWLIVVSMMVV